MVYTEGFKARMIERMAGPEGISAAALGEEVGVSQATLFRWLRERRLNGVKNPSKKQQRWTATEKLRVVREAQSLDDDQLGELLRREGLHEPQLRGWMEAVEASALDGLISQSARDRSKTSPEQKKIRKLLPLLPPTRRPDPVLDRLVPERQGGQMLQSRSNPEAP